MPESTISFGPDDAHPRSADIIDGGLAKDPSFDFTGLVMKPLAGVLLLFAMPILMSAEPATIRLVTDPQPGRAAKYGIEKIRAALESQGLRVEMDSTGVAVSSSTASKLTVVTGLGGGNSPAASLLAKLKLEVPRKPESLLVSRRKDRDPDLIIAGADDRGLMYALLDVADRVAWAKNSSDPFSEVRDIAESPDVTDRALSIYTFQKAAFEERFFNEDYWKRYFDMLARDRFNSFVLIFGYETGGYFAPAYPWFFDVDGFPNVHVPNVSKEQQERNLRTLNSLIEMAHDRGLRFNVGLWDHIYRGGVQSGGSQADPEKPGPDRVSGLNPDNLLDYSRAGLAMFLKLAPAIDGIQFRMHEESGLKPGEEQHAFWHAIFEVVQKERPALPLTLRAKGLPDDIIDDGLNMGLNVRVATKYWMEQVGLPFHPTHIPAKNQHDRRHSYADLLRYPQRYKIHWRLWTAGTIRTLLWGDPEYVRRFAESTHLYDGDGFEVTEPLGTKMQGQPHDQKPFELMPPQHRYYDYEFERYWHFFQVFGRVAYDPQTPSETWDREFAQRFGSDAGPVIENALHRASWILPRITATVFPYRNFPTTHGWAEKQRWYDLPQYAQEAEAGDTEQFQGIDEYARNLLAGVESAKLSPRDNSAWFAEPSRDILRNVDRSEELAGKHRNKEFDSTLVDLRMLAHLAGYHSHRINAGVNYASFTHTQMMQSLDDAISEEHQAIAEWEAIVKAAGDFYADDLLMGKRSADLCGHWRDELEALRKGMAALEQQRRDLAAKPSPLPDHPKHSPEASVTPPELKHIPVMTARAGEPLRIVVHVTDPSRVKWLRLRYRAVTQFQDYETLEMHRVGTSDDYEAIVPGAKIDPKWDFMYFFEVMDIGGHGKIHPDFEKETPYVVVRTQH